MPENYRQISRTSSKRSNQPYVVDVQFNLQSIFYDKRVNEIAQYLVDQVSIIQIQVGEIVEISSEELWVTGWPEEIYSVSILLREGDGPPFWGLSGDNWTGETNFDLIQYGLNKKEDRYRTSCEKVNEAWLLLVLDGQAESSLLDFHADLKGETYISSFDRTFVLGSYGKNLTELKVAPLAKKIK
ncbi:MAG: hypothetical protein IPJ82_13295 [Lewinellaceae bacterium]|nr:hypothetical protein [Lewinellaceae bacterium]